MKKFLTNPFVLVFIIVFAWTCSGYILYSFENRGTFGDMFGAINALFSGLAFAGVIYAILLQRKELELQREELKMTREELKKTAEASQKQAYFMGTQRQREDLYRLILKVSERIGYNYDEKKVFSPINDIFDKKPMNMSSIMADGNNVNHNLLLDGFYAKAQNKDSEEYKLILDFEADLKMLKGLLTEYEKVTGGEENCTPFPAFYKAEYKELVDMLQTYKLIKSDLRSYYCS